ncbi:MAG TPA: pyridoxamine 5'-phosphate oxidase family protein [Kineosporiaceae bacterium]
MTDVTSRPAPPADAVTTIEALEAIYDVPTAVVGEKETRVITPLQARYLEEAPLVILATSGPGGLDCSPRGDPAGFVRIVDERTLQLPDRRGNNRLDSLRNIVVDPRVALLFVIPGLGTTLRVNGTAVLRTDPELLASFAIDGRLPRTVLEIAVGAVYTQCPKAFIRGRVWDPELFRHPAELPTVGAIMQQITQGRFDGDAYDAACPERIRQTIY